MQVLITVSKGIIQNAVFFDDPKTAIHALSEFVRAMNIEHDDAVLYDRQGFIANAKHFLDENDEYAENKTLIEEISKDSEKPIYIIGNPKHTLGFMVTSPDDPLGYRDPTEAISDLGRMRYDFGMHLRLYQVLPVVGTIATRADVKRIKADSGIDDLDYSLVEEYIE